MASNIWQRTTRVTREETLCRHIGYSFRLAARALLYASSHRQDNTYHGLWYTSRGALDGTMFVLKRNEALTCTFTASCYSTRLSWAHSPVINWVVCLGQRRLQTDHLCFMGTLIVLMTGQGQVVTATQDRYIRVRHLRNRTTTATTSAAQIPGLLRILDKTVRNRPMEAGIALRRPVRCDVLTPRHLAERLLWREQRARWTRAWRSTALFSDQSRFLLSSADGRKEGNVFI